MQRPQLLIFQPELFCCNSLFRTVCGICSAFCRMNCLYFIVVSCFGFRTGVCQACSCYSLKQTIIRICTCLIPYFVLTCSAHCTPSDLRLSCRCECQCYCRMCKIAYTILNRRICRICVCICMNSSYFIIVTLSCCCTCVCKTCSCC